MLILIFTILIYIDKKSTGENRLAYSFNLFYKKIINRWPKISLLGQEFKNKLQKQYNRRHKSNIFLFILVIFLILGLLFYISLYLIKG